MHYCLLSNFLESTEKCNPDEILTLIDSPVHDLICNRSLMEVRVGCPKSDKNCFREVKNATCYLENNLQNSTPLGSKPYSDNMVRIFEKILGF